jgi:hypothetical protein
MGFSEMKRESINLHTGSLINIASIFFSLFIACIPCIAFSAPAGFFNEKVFNFGRILEGTEVPHNFIIENRGDSILNVLNVKSNCGCAVASFTKEIPPGSNGKISVVFDSKGSGGQDVEHKIRVETDDPKTGNFDLLVSGHVDPIVIIDPEKITLEGEAGKDIETGLSITPDPRHPFKVISAESKKGNVICSINEVEGSNPARYMITVKNLRKEKGEYKDILYLKTDSDIRPGISVRVTVNIR